jgi:hypothetical protein
LGYINFKLKSNLIPGKIIIPLDSIEVLDKHNREYNQFWDDYHKKYGNGGFRNISLPLFSIDKSTVIIKTGYSCGGLCGNGGIYIFRKINGKWKKINQLSEWVS